MKQTDLEKLANGLAGGTGTGTVTVTQTIDGEQEEFEYNIVGAANEVLGVAEEMEKYNLSKSDLTAEQTRRLDRGQKALQHLFGALGTHLDTLSKNDGTLELPNGNTVDLPNAAVSQSTNASVPDPTIF